MFQRDHQSADGCLPAAGLADQAERLSLPDAERLTFDTAWTEPTWRRKMLPAMTGNSLTKSVTVRMSGDSARAVTRGSRTRGGNDGPYFNRCRLDLVLNRMKAGKSVSWVIVVGRVKGWFLLLAHISDVATAGGEAGSW